MATGKRLQGSGYGEHGLVLEAGVQHFGRKLRSHFGKSGTGEGASWQKDRPERLSVVSRLTTAWAGAAKFHSAARYKGVARFDAKAADLDAGGSLGTESSSKDFGRRECENRQCADKRFRDVRTSHAGGVTGEPAECGTDGRFGTRSATAENPADYRGARGPLDEGSPPDAVAANSETHGIHRRHGQRTG